MTLFEFSVNLGHSILNSDMKEYHGKISTISANGQQKKSILSIVSRKNDKSCQRKLRHSSKDRKTPSKFCQDRKTSNFMKYSRILTRRCPKNANFANLHTSLKNKGINANFVTMSSPSPPKKRKFRQIVEIITLILLKDREKSNFFKGMQKRKEFRQKFAPSLSKKSRKFL